jgi:hypothetical protein
MHVTLTVIILMSIAGAAASSKADFKGRGVKLPKKSRLVFPEGVLHGIGSVGGD